jgi:diguanylate cyclase (GGDEF)-like protein/PAS domain S-box-containing protein
MRDATRRAMPGADEPSGAPACRVPGPRSCVADAGTVDLADRYRLLVELIPDGVVVHQDGRIVYANRSAVRLVAGTLEDLLGQEIFSFIHPDSRADLLQRLATLVEPGMPSLPAETILQRLDGGTTVVESVSVRTAWEGRPAMQAILRDLTEHKAAQAALRYQAALVEHVSDAIIATDAEGRVTSWNPAAEVIFTFTAGDVLGQKITDVLGAALDPRMLAASERAQVEVHRSEGVVLAVRATAAPLADGAGYVLLCSDETAWREAERRFTAVVSALEEGIVAVDATGTVRSVNPAAERLLGRPRAGLVGSPADALPLLDQDGAELAERNPLGVTHRTGVPQQGQMIVVDRPDGSRVWLTAHSRPLPASTGLPCSAVVSFSDITERRAAADQLQYAATHDSLTGLPNRALLLEKIADVRCRARDDGRMLAVLFVDLDRFKAINDSAGHAVGDEALRLVAKRLSAKVRDRDVVARIGGDEFVVLAEVTDSDDAQVLAARVLAGLTRPVAGRLGGHQLQASIGIVTAATDDERGPADLVRDADAAMYQAKTSGRNRVAVFDAALRTDALRKLQLDNDLRGALRGSGLWVAYQPLVELATGRWVGAEALSRWNHPTLGPINPLEFVTIAEQSDLIHDLGQRTLATACRDTVALRSTGAPDFSISVNLSVRQLDDAALTQRVQDVLDASGLPGSALCLEVTESSLAFDETHAARTLDPLRDLGIRLAIDDFGTGYSSLARLRTLPVDELKIDRSFITMLTLDQQARQVVAGIITLAHALDMRVVAEGVETAQHAQILTDLNCDLAQGYHYSRPVPLSDFGGPPDPA